VPAAVVALAALAFVPRVVLVDDGSRVVLAVQSEKPWPLPEGVRREDGHTVPAEVFDLVDRADAPVLEEQWEVDPCPAPVEDEDMREGGTGTHGAKGEEGTMGNPAPPPPPKARASVATTTDGFAVELPAHHYAVPVVAGEEVVVHVVTTGPFYAVDGPEVPLPSIDVPAGLRARFPEVYSGLFERIQDATPGAIVRESSVEARAWAPGFERLGWVNHGMPVVTRLHARPRAGTTQLVLGPTRERLDAPFRIHHRFAGPVRCMQPDRETWSTFPPFPVSAQADTAAACVRDIAVPELGLRAGGGRWARMAAFDRGALAGGVGGIVLAVVARARRRPQREK
jgi:hypothetical protein